MYSVVDTTIPILCPQNVHWFLGQNFLWQMGDEDGGKYPFSLRMGLLSSKLHVYNHTILILRVCDQWCLGD